MQSDEEGAIGMMTTLASLKLLTSDLPRALDRISNEPQVQRESEYYLQHIENVKSLDDFMSDYRVYNYAVTAFGLEDIGYAKAFIRRLLSEGIDNPDSLANKLVDPRYREFVEAFNFARYNTTATTFDRTRQGTVDRYVRQALEVDAGSSNEGVRLALYFQRKAPDLSNAYSLLADRALLRVTQVALGMPEASGVLSVDRQAELIQKRLDLADLKDPEKLDKFLTRFAALWDIESPSTTTTSPLVDLMSGQSSAAIGMDILSQLQNTRIGGR